MPDSVLRPLAFCTLETLGEFWAWRERWFGRGGGRDDRAWNSLLFALHHLRVGIYCALRKTPDGASLLFQPCVNTAYRNSLGLSQREFRRCVAAQASWPKHRRHRIRRDVATWSVNGTLLDNWEAAAPWTESNNDQFQRLLLAAAARVPDGTYEFLLNRRDSPQVPVILPPLARAAWRAADGQLRLLPCLSQYTHPSFMDRPIPPITAWAGWGGP